MVVNVCLILSVVAPCPVNQIAYSVVKWICIQNLRYSL